MKRKLYLFNRAGTAANYGIGTYIEQIIHLIKGTEIEPVRVELSRGNKEVETVNEDGIDKIRIPYEPVSYTEKSISRYNRNIAYLLKEYIPDDQTNIFHLNYLISEHPATWLKKMFKAKIILTVHYLEWSFALLGNITRWRKILTEDENNLKDMTEKRAYTSFQQEKSFFETVDKVICLSEHTAGLLKRDYRIDQSRLAVVYNGLKDVAGKKMSKIRLRKKYGLPDNAPVILFVGRLDAVKGLSYFIEAVKILLDRFPSCHALIAGSGDADTYLKTCGNKWMNIHFTGMLDKRDLYELYAVADIGVMPSLHEQCSYVAIEMMMHGIPLIASTSTGLCEMVEEGVTGLHVPVEEYPDRVEIRSELLAEKMQYLLQHPQERKRLGKNARRRYETVYSLEIMKENMLRLYADLG